MLSYQLRSYVPIASDFDDIAKWLLKFPSDPRHFYRSRIQNFEDTSNDQNRLALGILSWLHHSRGIEDLTVQQLTEALNVGKPELPQLSKDEIQLACQGLARVRYDYVQFVETTFNTYILEEPPKGLFPAERLARACLNSLDFRPPVTVSEDTSPASANRTFQEHAARFWGNYAAKAMVTARPDFKKFILEHLLSPKKRECLIGILQRTMPQTDEAFQQLGWKPLHTAAGQSPLHLLTSAGLDSLVLEILDSPLEIMKLLEISDAQRDETRRQLGNAKSVDNCEQTLLHYVASRKSSDATQLSKLISHGSPVGAKSKHGYTAMHCCAYAGNTAVMRLLLDTYIEGVTESSDHGYTPAHIAAQMGNLEDLTLLVENGADLSAETCEGYNTLHCAAAFGHIPVMEYILAIKPELLNVGPMSALHRAVENCQVEAITTLLKYGADVMSKARVHLYGLPDVTPLEVSIKNGETGSAEDLISYGAYLRIYKNFLVTRSRWANLNGDGRMATKLAVDDKPVSKTAKEWDTVDMDNQPLTIGQLQRLHEASPHHPILKLLLAQKNADEGVHRFVTAQRLFESFCTLDQVLSESSDEKKSEAKTPEVVHRTVQCNFCKMHPLLGLRYKCAQCPHFDICRDCWKQKGHDFDHPLIIVPSIEWFREHKLSPPKTS